MPACALLAALARTGRSPKQVHGSRRAISILFRRFLRPSPEQPPDHYQLAKVIGAVVGHQD